MAILQKNLHSKTESKDQEGIKAEISKIDDSIQLANKIKKYMGKDFNFRQYLKVKFYLNGKKLQGTNSILQVCASFFKEFPDKSVEKSLYFKKCVFLGKGSNRD